VSTQFGLGFSPPWVRGRKFCKGTSGVNWGPVELSSCFESSRDCAIKSHSHSMGQQEYSSSFLNCKICYVTPGKRGISRVIQDIT
jgi:hypothetical protein